MLAPVLLRAFSEADAVEVTELLHEAFAPLADAGLNYTAADQGVDVTLRRAGAGHCVVAELDGVLVATATVSLPGSQRWAAQVEAARDPHRAWVAQLAVRPSVQGRGIARQLVEYADAWAAARGATSLALDTAEPAQHLVGMYRRWGFDQADTVQLPGKTYRSVVMVRPIDAVPRA